MATNSQNTYPITGAAVPADRQCIKNGTDVVNLVQDFCAVQGLGGNSGSSFPSQDSVGQQALQLAQSLSNQLATLQSQTPQIRQSSNPAPLPTGTNEIQISWTTPLPNNNYSVLITIQLGSSVSSAGANFFWGVVTGSQTTTSCTIHFDDVPSGAKWLYSWTVIAAPAATATGPVISNFTPTSGAPGSTVTIFGSGFTNVSTVTFGGSTAAFTFNSDTQITATVPAGASTGAISVVVGLNTAISTTSFTVT